MKVISRTQYGLTIVVLLLLLAACGGAPAGTSEQPTTAPGSDTTATGDTGVPTTAIEVRDPWVRAAVMTGGESSMAMGEATPEHGMAMGEGTPEAGMEMSQGTPAGDMAMDHGAGGTSAAYMTLVNTGSTPDALISAATDAAETVELHLSSMDNGVMTMRPVENIEVPANGEVELKPGGLHVMLIGLKQNLEAGDMVTLTLTLENAGEVEIEAPVRQP